MNTNSNSYTVIFSVVMVVIVATALALTAEGLKPMQKENVRREKMQNILSSMGVETDRDGAAALFDTHVKERLVLNASGEETARKSGEVKAGDTEDAFNIDVQKEYKEWKAGSRSANDINYPLFICDKDGATIYVVPLVGTGLWGPIWGYIALESDMRTIAGTSFDHKTETPGLGAEINEKPFQAQFEGKFVSDKDGTFTSVKVVKGGATNEHEVDAISGGTITSDGVDEMIERTLKVYEPYFKSNQ